MWCLIKRLNCSRGANKNLQLTIPIAPSLVFSSQPQRSKILFCLENEEIIKYIVPVFIIIIIIPIYCEVELSIYRVFCSLYRVSNLIFNK